MSVHICVVQFLCNLIKLHFCANLIYDILKLYIHRLTPYYTAKWLYLVIVLSKFERKINTWQVKVCIMYGKYDN
jgi:hypothetical protein